MKVSVFNFQSKYWVDTRKIKKLLINLLRYYQLDNKEVTLVLVNNRKMKELNKKFLKRDSTTDVLSFPFNEKTVDGAEYLGDIVISVPQAFNQCFTLKHGLEREIEILAIHGFLHLIGFDHQNDDNNKMKAEEQKLAEKFIEK
ncbi:MAG: rRNA maturation RNase YbeY [Candidatus Aminicenantia bacterium]